MTVRLRDIMRAPIICIDVSGTVKETARKMVEHNIGSVVVTRDSEPVGIITKTDILKNVTSRGISSLEVKVSEIMSSPLITISAHVPIGDAALEMQAKKVKRFLITENGKVVGMVSQKDLQESIMKTLLTFLRPGYPTI